MRHTIDDDCGDAPRWPLTILSDHNEAIEVRPMRPLLGTLIEKWSYHSMISIVMDLARRKDEEKGANGGGINEAIICNRLGWIPSSRRD